MENNTDIKPVTMTAQDAAKYIGISYWLILEMTKQNKIPFVPCGSRKLFRKAALDKWLEEMETNALIEADEKEVTNKGYGALRKIL